jgi:hypothetical protein
VVQWRYAKVLCDYFVSGDVGGGFGEFDDVEGAEGWGGGV